jgi:ATP-dependent DNA helicase RecG
LAANKSIQLDNHLTTLPGFGKVKAEAFWQNGIKTIRDLVLYFPRNYLDRSKFIKLRDCAIGENANVEIEVISSRPMGFGRKKRLLVEVWDGADRGILTYFHAVNFFIRKFNPGQKYFLSGRAGNFRGLVQFIHPDLEAFQGEATPADSIHTGRIIPVYPLNEELRSHGIDSRTIRNGLAFVFKNIPEINDPLPRDVLDGLQLIHLGPAMKALHFPESFPDLEKARDRVAFQELLLLSIYLERIKYVRSKENKERSYLSGREMLQKFINSLPFTLTAEQKTGLDEIIADMDKSDPMLRLLEGEVGSGKTVVALGAAIYVMAAGSQVAIMVPTEVLARQHATSINKFLAPLDMYAVSLLGGNYPGKAQTLEELKNGEAKLVIGTHALIQKNVAFKNLALVIIDEQHRFGVEQRSALISKGEQVDCLVMTATPIPRSLSLTAFGEMELSQIKELPKGREPVETLIFEETKRKSIYNSLRKYINQKRQIYYLFPVIEESEESDLKSLEEGFKILSREVFPEFQISMIHGRMNSQEKTQIMKLFSLGHIQLLVTTTVVEVGIDVPNANVIVIEHPERFGLSQLHQLRGRVGRGKGPAFCVLVLPEGIPSATRERLEEFSKILDGFAIAELDLALRGPGDFLGLRQSGIPPFRVADISRDFGLLEKAKKISQEIIAMDPEMESERFQNLKTFMQTFDWLELATRIN